MKAWWKLVGHLFHPCERLEDGLLNFEEVGRVSKMTTAVEHLVQCVYPRTSAAWVNLSWKTADCLSDRLPIHLVCLMSELRKFCIANWKWRRFQQDGTFDGKSRAASPSNVRGKFEAVSCWSRWISRSFCYPRRMLDPSLWTWVQSSINAVEPQWIPHSKKGEVGQVSIMASVFWDSHGILMFDYLAKGKTINDMLISLKNFASLLSKHNPGNFPKQWSSTRTTHHLTNLRSQWLPSGKQGLNCWITHLIHRILLYLIITFPQRWRGLSLDVDFQPIKKLLKR